MISQNIFLPPNAEIEAKEISDFTSVSVKDEHLHRRDQSIGRSGLSIFVMRSNADAARTLAYALLEAASQQDPPEVPVEIGAGDPVLVAGENPVPQERDPTPVPVPTG